MAERNENEDLNQMKNSAEKRRQNSRKNKIQRILMQRTLTNLKKKKLYKPENFLQLKIKWEIVLQIP